MCGNLNDASQANQLGHVVCGGCQVTLAYAYGAQVRCARCALGMLRAAQAVVARVPGNGLLRNCSRQAAPRLCQCSPTNEPPLPLLLPPTNTLQAVKCAVCSFITPVGSGGGGGGGAGAGSAGQQAPGGGGGGGGAAQPQASVAASSKPPSTTVLVENPGALDEAGNEVPSLSVGVSNASKDQAPGT